MLVSLYLSSSQVSIDLSQPTLHSSCLATELQKLPQTSTQLPISPSSSVRDLKVPRAIHVLMRFSGSGADTGSRNQGT